MKQKGGKLQVKSNSKGVQKAAIAKDARKRVTAPPPPIKNTEKKKNQHKITPKMPIPDDDDDDDDEEVSDNEVDTSAEDDEEISADANASADSNEDDEKDEENSDVEAEDDDDEDENENTDDDEEEDVNENDEDEEDEDESPEETPIVKKDVSKKPVKKPDAKEQERNQNKAGEKKENAVFVRNLKLDTSQEELKQHFAACGKIAHAKLVTRGGTRYAFVEFTTIDAAKAALKLHNSNLKGGVINVYIHGDKSSKTASKDPKRTVVVTILENRENYSADVIFKIFRKYGEIENIDIVCKSNFLAFVTFKNEESVGKSLELHRTIMEGSVLEVKKFQVPGEDQKNKTVFMLNVKPGVTQDDLRKFFADTGKLEKVVIKDGYAVVKFVDTESFCKSFLQNENLLAGQPVFLEPYSEKKKFILNKPKMGGKRKMFPNKNNGRSKKFRKNSNET